MTALEAFQRLEAQGIWRESDSAQRRDVIVSFGDATLTISANAETPLSHWSLAAVRRQNPGLRPALFSPGPDSAETLEISDDTMIDAIEKVRRAVRKKGSHPRRLRLWVGLAGLVAATAATLFWMPPALHGYAASIVPPATRLELGQSVLNHMRQLSGARCDRPGMARILNQTLERLRPGFPGRIVVVRDIWPSRILPGAMMAMDARLIENFDSADTLAGFVLADLQRLSATDPMLDMLRQMGIGSTIELLTTGEISEPKLRLYAQSLVDQPPAAVDSARLIEAFRLARVSTEPYAKAITPDDSAVAQDLAARNPTTIGLAEPVLGDNDWVKLQAICD